MNYSGARLQIWVLNDDRLHRLCPWSLGLASVPSWHGQLAKLAAQPTTRLSGSLPWLFAWPARKLDKSQCSDWLQQAFLPPSLPPRLSDEPRPPALPCFWWWLQSAHSWVFWGFLRVGLAWKLLENVGRSHSKRCFVAEGLLKLVSSCQPCPICSLTSVQKENIQFKQKYNKNVSLNRWISCCCVCFISKNKLFSLSLSKHILGFSTYLQLCDNSKNRGKESFLSYMKWTTNMKQKAKLNEARNRGKKASLFEDKKKALNLTADCELVLRLLTTILKNYSRSLFNWCMEQKFAVETQASFQEIVSNRLASIKLHMHLRGQEKSLTWIWLLIVHWSFCCNFFKKPTIWKGKSKARSLF